MLPQGSLGEQRGGQLTFGSVKMLSGKVQILRQEMWRCHQPADGQREKDPELRTRLEEAEEKVEKVEVHRIERKQQSAESGP